MRFHNSTLESGQHLIQFESAAKTQDDKVLEVFNLVKKPMTWSEVSGFLDFHEGSIKRSLTNLATAGLLEKTTDKVLGKYGKPNYKYKLI